MTATSVIDWIESTQVYGTATKQVPIITSVTKSARWIADGLDSNIKVVSEAATIKNIQKAVVTEVTNRTARVREFASSKVAATTEFARENIQHSVSRIQQSLDAVPQVKSTTFAAVSYAQGFVSQAKAYSDAVPDVIATYKKEYPIMDTNAILATLLLLICTLFATISSILAKLTPSQPKPEAERQKREPVKGKKQASN